MKLIKLCGVLVAVVALSSSAFGVISLVYEEGPNTGQGVVPGTELTFKIGNFDVGTLYGIPGPLGYSGLPAPFDGGGTAAGVAALDAVGVSPLGAQALGTYPGLNGGLEDTWGIGRITRIEDPAGAAVWTPAVKGHQLNAIFSALQDIHIEPSSVAGNTRISGVGLDVKIYNSPTFLDATGGTAARLPGNIYPGINDAGQLLELSMISLPGYINGPGTGAAEATEFESDFNFVSLKGSGQAFMEILGGSSQFLFDGSFWGLPDAYPMAQSPGGAANAATLGALGGFDLAADVHLQFTTDVNDGGPGGTPLADWLVESDDPMKVKMFVPEPLTMLGLFMGLGGVGAYIRKRRMV